MASEDPMTVARRSRRVRTATLIYGAVFGFLAYLVGYLLAYVTALESVTRSVRGHSQLEAAGGVLAPAWKIAGWAFFDAHFVGTRFPTGAGLIDLVGLGSVEFLYLVPPLLLLIAGAIVASIANVPDSRSGMLAGMTPTIGYLLFVIIGTDLVSYAGIHSDFVRAVVIAGLVYPLGFGAIGGSLVGLLRADRASPVPGHSVETE